MIDHTSQDFWEKARTDKKLKAEIENEVLEKVKTIKSSDQQDKDRVNSLIKYAGNLTIAEILKKVEPIVNMATEVINKVSPYVLQAVDLGVRVYSYLPTNILFALLGLLLCFFGGVFAITIAAAEAFYYSGFETFKNNVLFLYYEFEVLWKKSREDDKLDEDNDGVADIRSLTAKQLITRKIGLYFANCKDPAKLMGLIGDLVRCLMGVVAVLKLEFAKVVALGTMIGENMRKPVSYIVVPTVSSALPEKYHQWISPSINYGCKFIAISIAWFIQRIISSVQSAIRGGLMFSRHIMKFLKNLGYMSLNDEETYLDEFVGWGIGMIGVYFQIVHFFSVPFPFNLVLFPLSIAESTLSWITSQ